MNEKEIEKLKTELGKFYYLVEYSTLAYNDILDTTKYLKEVNSNYPETCYIRKAEVECTKQDSFYKDLSVWLSRIVSIILLFCMFTLAIFGGITLWTLF